MSTPANSLTNLPRAFLRQCRRSLRGKKVADSTGAELTGGALLMRSLILRRWILRTLGKDEQFVGVLVPPSVPGVVVNAALALCGRVAVNLNYTVSSEILNYCIRQCGIKHVLTSRKFMERVDLKLDVPVIFLEDLREQINWKDKAAAAIGAYATPLTILERKCGLTKIQPDDLFTVIFTSGSTGQPKGVMLTHRNVASNTAAVDEVFRLVHEDVICGILPFFHSFGFTVTLWSVLALDVQGAYHFSPLDARQVGKLCQEHRVTILISTPTFLRSFLRRCTPEEFATLDVVVVGAEKLNNDLSDAFEQKFGVRPVEGYGTTELSPLVAVNIPPSRAVSGKTDGVREGTVGRALPGVKAKTVHPETEQPITDGSAGLLLITGPNVMQGYLKQPELTAKVMRDGWYITGDIAELDNDGFIKITGRQSRFSKIGGEMVPHGRIEELLGQIIAGEEGHLQAVVSAVPDSRKGERLVVFHTPINKSPEELNKGLSAAGLPNLWIPSTDSYCQVDEIPVLGTGKLDLHKLKQLALEKFPAEAAGKHD